jgi:hypothetical protein
VGRLAVVLTQKKLRANVRVLFIISKEEIGSK